MLKLFHQNKVFFLPYVLFLLIAGVLIISYDKSTLHLTINQFHSNFFDWFFRYVTHLGHGYFVLFITLILAFIKFKYAFMNLFIYISSGLIAQGLKRFVFSDFERPVRYFGDQESLYLIENVKPLLHHSFPSGHTTTAFGLCLFLAIITKNHLLKLFLFIIALLIGFSRVYLSHHFLEDIVAGSVIGILTAVIIYQIFSKKQYSWYDNHLMDYIKI